MIKKIVAISMVKNEMDIIESFVRHTLSFADELMIVDHMSSDRTPEILEKLQEEGLPLTVEEIYDTRHLQSEAMSSLLQKAASERNADLIIPLDADEFIVNTYDTVPCREILEELDPTKQYTIRWWAYEPLYPNDDEDVFLLSRPLIREAKDLGWQKAVVGGDFAREHFPLKLIQGNHFAYRDTESGQESFPAEHLEKVYLAHIHWRSDAQFAAKVLSGWLSSLSKYSVNTPSGWYWKKCYRSFMNGETIKPEIRSPERFDMRPYVHPQILRYSSGVRPDPVKNLMATSEAIAEAFLESRILLRKKVVTIVIPWLGDMNLFKRSLFSARAQTYPYKEIFVPVLAEETDDMIDGIGEGVRILRASDGDVFDRLEVLPSGAYVQWILPGDEITPDKVMKMVACMESQDYPLAVTFADGHEDFLDWAPWLTIFVNDEFLMLVPDTLWKNLLTFGRYPSGGVTSALMRRQVMDDAGWFAGAFLDARPLKFAMWRDMLGACKGDDVVGCMREKYCISYEKSIDTDEWLWHQIEWQALLEQDAGLLTTEGYESALQRLIENERIATRQRGVASPDIWEQYEAAMDIVKRGAS